MGMMINRRRLMALSTLKPHIKDEFVRVEYIENTSTAYIDTLIKPSEKINIDAKLQFNNLVGSDNDMWIFGGRNSAAQAQLSASALTDGSIRYGWSNKHANVNNVITDNEKIYEFKTTLNTLSVSDSETTTDITVSATVSSFTSNNTIYIFNLNVPRPSRSPFLGKIYSFKIYENDVLVRNFIPVLNKTTDEYGMYDLVEQKFYTSPNGAKFVGGREIIYDAEIEYLESTGTQWINTGVYHNEGQSYAIDIIATPTKGETDFIATRIGEGGMVVGFYNYFIFGYNKPNLRIDTRPLEVKETELHIEYEFKDGNRTLTVNGISYSKKGATYSANSTIRIYGAYQEGCNSSIKCKRVVFRDANNNLLIDMIPVRVGQVGYMYDKVSGELFGNSGTGAFILGPDKVAGG